MWNKVVDSINQATGGNFQAHQQQAVSGGDINKAYKISDGQNAYFVKINTLDCKDSFVAEQAGLAHIRENGSLNCPDVVCVGTTSSSSFLVLEYLHLVVGRDEDWHELGQRLARMHQPSEQKMYGWDDENYIGATSQSNHWHKKWSVFFAEERIGWQLQLLKEKNQHIANHELVIQRVHDLLQHYSPTIALVHGDLWRGNVGFCDKGPVIFDPACYYGDPEVDLAMTELFGRFPEAFYQGYYALRPISEGALQRKQLYNLYHVLNHANMFAGQYLQQAKQIIEQWVL